MESPEQPADEPKPTWRQAWRQAPVSMFFSTFFGVGHIPGGPGTYAAALFTPAIVWMSTWPLGWRVGPFVVVTLLSMWWADRAGKALGEHDSRRIVMDEVVGVWATLVWFSNLSWLAALVGLVLFRIFDVTKPPPARRLDDEGDNGITVIADDLVAGVWAIPGVVLVVWLFAAQL
ncbi:phosphatidylglycerophosphatase A [Persicimonas caeni]|uniref:Phosphatidylglycerophosphatase A n=1 Tax=Persicimonas caeni TaxID=2292766 RepID=A0A4Y6PSA5_PERCE|nr:phosphatidylglycerophosphatase A [Persicimonas caeni]QDG51216.1 phosphatidylglycerophosphatase A [Persicimonas caeni]QED32437.1 phosphatidylglycerophosphatase A [Persicimonas caeni]